MRQSSEPWPLALTQLSPLPFPISPVTMSAVSELFLSEPGKCKDKIKTLNISKTTGADKIPLVILKNIKYVLSVSVYEII